MIRRLLGALRGSLLGELLAPARQEIPPIPARFEIAEASYGVFHLFDRARGRRYSFKTREHAETALRMVAEGCEGPFLLWTPFKSDLAL